MHLLQTETKFRQRCSPSDQDEAQPPKIPEYSALAIGAAGDLHRQYQTLAHHAPSHLPS